MELCHGASSLIVPNDLCNRRVCPQCPTYQPNRHNYRTQNHLCITQHNINSPSPNYFQETEKRRLQKAQFIYLCSCSFVPHDLYEAQSWHYYCLNNTYKLCKRLLSFCSKNVCRVLIRIMFLGY